MKLLPQGENLNTDAEETQEHCGKDRSLEAKQAGVNQDGCRCALCDVTVEPFQWLICVTVGKKNLKKGKIMNPLEAQMMKMMISLQFILLYLI